jgi:hypothetical protein
MAKYNRIIGAGLAGLIAACHFKDAEIYEAGPRQDNHKALLRFRDESVSNLTGIPFKPVTVDKAIYLDGCSPGSRERGLYGACTIQMANWYATKTTGHVAGRSIWNLERATRYIAPEDFHQRLVDKAGFLVNYEKPIDTIHSWDKHHYNTISTAPLPVMLKAAGIELPHLQTEKAPIKVQRFRIPKCDVYQTIYFPEMELRVFRASITGDMLIIESVMEKHNSVFDWWYMPDAELDVVLTAFGLNHLLMDIEHLEDVEQKYGKIVPISSEQRHAVLYELTERFGVYSLGRFATWRNILLDDVVKDIAVIDRLIKASDYGRLHMTSEMV